MNGFKQGELILTSQPYAYVLNNFDRGRRCDYCFIRSESLKRCSQCSFVYFCNRECQSKAWDEHKEECKSIKKVHPKEPTPSLRLIAQLILKTKKLGFNEPYEEVGGLRRSFKDLESHAEEIKKDGKCCQQMVAFIGTLKDYIGEKNIPSPTDFTEIFGRMVINTFSIWDAEMQSIGSGLYLGASIFDHSCEPDVEVVFEGTTLLARAVCDIPHKDLKRTYISYIDQMQLTEERQKHLSDQYYFTCHCSRCTNLYLDELMTKTVVSKESAKMVEANSKKAVERIKQMKKDKVAPAMILSACIEDLQLQEGFLADSHISRIRLLEFSFDACIQLSRWTEAMTIGLQLIEPYRLYYGNYHPNFGIQLFKVGKIEHLIGRLKDSEKHLIEAEHALSVSHGHKHPLYQDLLKLLNICQQEVAIS